METFWKHQKITAISSWHYNSFFWPTDWIPGELICFSSWDSEIYRSSFLRISSHSNRIGSLRDRTGWLLPLECRGAIPFRPAYKPKPYSFLTRLLLPSLLIEVLAYLLSHLLFHAGRYLLPRYRTFRKIFRLSHVLSTLSWTHDYPPIRNRHTFLSELSEVVRAVRVVRVDATFE